MARIALALVLVLVLIACRSRDEVEVDHSSLPPPPPPPSPRARDVRADGPLTDADLETYLTIVPELHGSVDPRMSPAVRRRMFVVAQRVQLQMARWLDAAIADDPAVTAEARQLLAKLAPAGDLTAADGAVLARHRARLERAEDMPAHLQNARDLSAELAAGSR